MPEFRQRDATDCGAACLAYIACHFGRAASVAEIRGRAGTDQHGTTVLGLVEAAESLGFSGKGVKGPADALPTVPLPAIAHCRLEGGALHYIVLLEWGRKHARVMDPAVGRPEKWPRDRFTAMWTGVLVLVAPSAAVRARGPAMSPLKRLADLLRTHAPALAQAVVGAVFGTLLTLSTSIYVQKIVDDVIPDANRPLLDLLTIGMVVILGVRVALGALQSLLALRTAQQVDAALILGYYGHLLRLPQPFFDTMRVGEIISRVADAVKIRNFLNGALVSLVLNPLILLFAFAAMFFYSGRLAGLSLVLVTANAFVYALVNWGNRRFQRDVMERGADLDAQLVASLGAQPVIRRFQLEEAESLKTEIRLVRLLQTVWRASRAALAANTAGTLVTSVYLTVLLWSGAGLVLDARLTPGELMSCYTLAGYLTGPITALLGLNGTLQETLIATDRLFEIIDLELERDQGTIAFTPALAGDLRFEGVGFKPPGRLATLQQLNLTLPAGRLTALTGPSGCGKSTLLALLQRLYLPSEGRILVGDTDLNYFQLASLRRHLAVVPQQTHLLSGTLLENLAAGDPQPDLQRVLQLAREVGALEFIEQLPQGFFTHLSENGANLSGGQRQRLAVVRALYWDAPILLLDEPTSALDADAEAALIRVLGRLRAAGRTIIAATHAPRLLAAADRVIELNAGRVASVRDAGL